MSHLLATAATHGDARKARDAARCFGSANRLEARASASIIAGAGFVSSRALGVDAGLAERKGPGVNQYLALVRPSIKYVMGQLTIDATYDYGYELFVNSETRQRQTFYFRLKRVF